METDINMERDKTPLVILLIVIVIGLGLWLYRSRSVEPIAPPPAADSGSSEVESAATIPSTNPLERMPSVNPTAGTNPYRSVKTNPFE